MIAHKLELNNSSNVNDNEEYSIPLDITDIINICKEYNKLGLNIQGQVEVILELGLEEAIQSGNIKIESLPHIKNFLRAIYDNPYFGDATDQSQGLIYLIQDYLEKNKLEKSKLN